MKYSVPKLKYKGNTVQYQRIRAKKNVKIEQLNSKPLTEEEQSDIQAKNYEKIKEQETEVKQQRPKWKLF